jgi:hypothetical protein
MRVQAASEGDLTIKAVPNFFRIWAHRSAGSLFGAASSPVIRNGAFLCFEDEARAQAECDRLNARRGDVHVHYSVMPTHIEASLPQEMKRKPTEAPSFPALATAPCLASDRRSRQRRTA